MSLAHYPQTLSDVVPGLRLLCNDRVTLWSIGYTKPAYAIVMYTKFFKHHGDICTIRFVDRERGGFITQHDYLYYIKNGVVTFEQIQTLYDVFIVTMSTPINFTNS